MTQGTSCEEHIRFPATQDEVIALSDEQRSFVHEGSSRKPGGYRRWRTLKTGMSRIGIIRHVPVHTRQGCHSRRKSAHIRTDFETNDGVVEMLFVIAEL